MIPVGGIGSITFFIINEVINANIMASILLRLIGMISGYMCSYMGILFIYHTMQTIIEKLNITRQSKIWNGLKEESFGIYLFHQQIIYLTIIPLNGNVPSIVQVMISFLCAVVIASIITSVLRRFKLTKTLYGV